jgi:hypothetical protein
MKYKHILVFDTSALLSANRENRIQVWRINFCIPIKKSGSKPEPRHISQASEPQRTQNPHLVGGNSSEKNVSSNDPKISHSNNPLIDFKNPVVIACTAIVLAFGIFLFTNREQKAPTSSSQIPGIIPQAVAASSEAFQKTPSTLIAEAEVAIPQFQRTKNPSSLTQPLNVLQELKNKQGGKLDEDGEQRLSRLKHKYAIEVLANSGQLSEAAILLREIPKTYTDINAVREWLVKHNR